MGDVVLCTMCGSIIVSVRTHHLIILNNMFIFSLFIMYEISLCMKKQTAHSLYMQPYMTGSQSHEDPPLRGSIHSLYPV